MFIGVMLQPRRYFPRLAASPSVFWALVLPAVWGVERALTRTVLPAHTETSTVMYLGKSVAMGIVMSIGMFWAAAWVMAWGVRVFGGRADETAVRAVLTWAATPRLIALAAVLLLFAVEGPDVIWVERKELARLLPFGPLVLLAQMVSGAWTTWLAVVGLSAVSGLSTGRTILTYLLGGGLLVAGIFAVVFAARLL